MEGDWPQLEGLLTRRGGCTYLSHGTGEFRASSCLINDFGTLIFWPHVLFVLLFHPVGMGHGVKHVPRRAGAGLFLYLLSETPGGRAGPLRSQARVSRQLAPSGRSVSPAAGNELRKEFCSKDRPSAEGPAETVAIIHSSHLAL